MSISSVIYLSIYFILANLCGVLLRISLLPPPAVTHAASSADLAIPHTFEPESNLMVVMVK